MPKHNPQRVKIEKEFKEKPRNIEVVSVPKSEYSYQTLALRIDAKLKITGLYSGREYEFDGAGSTQDVDTRDVEWMLEKRQGGRQCCGGTDFGNIVFILAEE